MIILLSVIMSSKHLVDYPSRVEMRPYTHMRILSINVATFNPIIHSQGQLCSQARGNVIKNPFWCIYNLNNDFISLDLITLDRESNKETKLFDSNGISKSNGKGLEDGTSCQSVYEILS